MLYVSSPNGYVWQHFVCNICVAYSYIMFVLRINQHNAIWSMYRVVYSADTVVPKSAKLTRLSAVQVGKYNLAVRGLSRPTVKYHAWSDYHTFVTTACQPESIQRLRYRLSCRLSPVAATDTAGQHTFIFPVVLNFHSHPCNVSHRRSKKNPDRPLVNPNTSVCLEGNPAGKIEINWDG